MTDPDALSAVKKAVKSIISRHTKETSERKAKLIAKAYQILTGEKIPESASELEEDDLLALLSELGITDAASKEDAGSETIPQQTPAASLRGKALKGKYPVVKPLAPALTEESEEDEPQKTPSKPPPEKAKKAEQQGELFAFETSEYEYETHAPKDLSKADALKYMKQFAKMISEMVHDLTELPKIASVKKPVSVFAHADKVLPKVLVGGKPSLTLQDVVALLSVNLEQGPSRERFSEYCKRYSEYLAKDPTLVGLLSREIKSFKSLDKDLSDLAVRSAAVDYLTKVKKPAVVESSRRKKTDAKTSGKQSSGDFSLVQKTAGTSKATVPTTKPAEETSDEEEAPAQKPQKSESADDWMDA